MMREEEYTLTLKFNVGYDYRMWMKFLVFECKGPHYFYQIQSE
jgi:hypothetical protein